MATYKKSSGWRKQGADLGETLRAPGVTKKLPPRLIKESTDPEGTTKKTKRGT